MTRIHIEHSAGSMEKKIVIELEEGDTTPEVLAEILMDEKVRKYRDMMAATADKQVGTNIVMKFLEKLNIY